MLGSAHEAQLTCVAGSVLLTRRLRLPARRLCGPIVVPTWPSYRVVLLSKVVSVFTRRGATHQHEGYDDQPSIGINGVLRDVFCLEISERAHNF